MSRLMEVYGREAVTVQVRSELEALRRRVPEQPRAQDVEALEASAQCLPATIERELQSRLGGDLRRVINATGVFLHTNLGRAPLPTDVASRLPAFLDASCDLEMDLESGKRANRNARVERLLCALVGAEAAVVVNNNAAALVLQLQCVARDREVVVSRGELVEIGGSFRIPDILETAGATLREVGTTNRTRVSDYEGAIGAATGALLKVHPSNYRIGGFVEEVSAADLVELGRKHAVPVLVDEGSGLLRSSDRPQLRDHASLAELVAAGVDAACGSGDKLVGGPQAGLIVGREEMIVRFKKHPLYRAMRPSRATLFTLEAVLRIHLAGGELPIDRLWLHEEELRRRLEPLRADLGGEIVTADGYVGGGAAPEAPIPGLVLALEGSARLAEALRRGDPSVVGYIQGGQLLLDLRTVDPKDDTHVLQAVRQARASLESG